jgi:dTDP-4-amino-4,6-dideoxygalactose transaminase
MSNWRIPLTDLDYGEEELSAVESVVRAKWLSMGPEVARFEQDFAEHHQVRHAIAVSSATAALHLAFLAVGIGPGDEVIQPALNFVAAANLTVLTGATPAFADIVGLGDPTLDPEHVRRLITPRTKAVVAMHYGGQLCQMRDLLQICNGHSLVLIEDACHAVGVKCRNGTELGATDLFAGGIGDIGTFSFFSNKNLATGEGGMVVTNQDEIAGRVRLMRSHGMSTLTWDRHRGHASSYDVELHGWNYRSDELRAALGRVQLKKLSRNNERRREILQQYRAQLEKFDDWQLPLTKDAETSGHLMVAVAPDAERRRRAADHLRDHRVQSSLHYPCIADFTAFRRWQSAEVPATREFSSRALSLPIFPGMSASQVEEVCRLVRDAG